MSELFNREVKEEYIEQLRSSSVKRLTRSVFKMSKEYEEYFKKDFYDFIKPEIMELLASMNAISFNSLNSKCSVLRTYTRWAIDRKLSKDNINHYDSITPEEIRECLNKFIQQKKYITLAELDELSKDFLNISDAALCYCLYFGIYGKQGIEIKNLTEESISTSENKVSLVTGRTVILPSRIINILYESCEEYDYILPEDKKFGFMALDPTDKSVFKKRVNARYDTIESNHKRILSRLVKLKNDTGCVSLGISRLKNSGLLETIKNYIDDHPESLDTLYSNPEIRNIYKTWDMTFPPIKKTFYSKIYEYIY